MIQTIKSGSKVSDVFLVKEIQFLKTKDKRPYTALTFIDKSGEIRSFVWDTHLSHIRAGTFVKASGAAAEHKGDMVIRLDETGIMPVKKPDNLDDYIYALDAVTIKSLWEELMGFINGMQDKFYKTIVSYFIHHHDEIGGEFNLKTCPLTDESYGSYAGALLEHIVYCLRHAKAIHHNYFDRNAPLDPDLLAAILILHDAGRLKSFKHIFNVTKTQEAKMAFHNSLSTEILEFIISHAEMSEADWSEVKKMKLRNGIIVAAGLDMKFNTIEGMLANRIQNMDALVGVMSRALNFAKQDQELVWCKILQTEILNG